MGYHPNITAIKMQSIDIWRVKDGKVIEHLLDIFMRRHSLTQAPPPPHV